MKVTNLSELALFNLAATRSICQMRSALAVNQTRLVRPLTCTQYRCRPFFTHAADELVVTHCQQLAFYGSGNV